MNNVRNEISNLSQTEKFELIDALWESLETDPHVTTGEQHSELDASMARYQSDPSDVIPWEQVKAGLFRQQ
ncbi:MAG: addiction module component, family [Bryobacterales bacterium]|nr:addiction module component, family [Bryobacterales bacterium]